MPLPAQGRPDLLIGASLHDLWLLALRRGDPDTLDALDAPALARFRRR